MARLVGLAHASVLYRELESLHHLTQFSQQGNEVAFGTIGQRACAEGHFWEAVNAIGVLQAPAVLSIWDDGYAISVTNEHAIYQARFERTARRLPSPARRRARLQPLPRPRLGLPCPCCKAYREATQRGA